MEGEAPGRTRKGALGYLLPQGPGGSPASGLLSAVPPCFLWALRVRRERRERSRQCKAQSWPPAPERAWDSPAGQGFPLGARAGGGRRSDGARPACRPGRPGEVLPSWTGLEAGRVWTVEGGSLGPCRRQEVAGSRPGWTAGLPGALLVGPRRGGMGKGAGGQLCAGPVVRSGASPGDPRGGDHGSRKGVLNGKQSVTAGSLALSLSRFPGPGAGGPPVLASGPATAPLSGS